MATLSITNLEIYARLGMMLGINRDYTQWSAETLADVNRVIRSGRRRFFSATQWSFLEVDTLYTTISPQIAGTVTIASGVVTLVGSTFPTTLIDDYLFVPEGGGVYQFRLRTDTTHATLYDTTVNADALSTYSLYKFRYALPTNFAGFLGPVTRETEQQVALSEFAVLPNFQIKALHAIPIAQTGQPEAFAVAQTLAEETGISSWYLTVWPLPDTVYTIKARIRIQPGDTLEGAVSDPVFHPVFAECMTESILAAGELAFQDQYNGPHAQRFAELVIEAVKKDRAMRGVQRLLPRSLGHTLSRYQTLIDGTVDLSTGIL